ncbi:MAG: chorismate mutase [Mycobacterium leprae]
MTVVRAIRGAITVPANEREAILAATGEMLAELCARNDLDPADLVSAFFTVTPDLSAAFPAEAARRRGWVDLPMMCATEIPVPGSLPLCVRVMLHVNSNKAQSEVNHVYLRDAVRLRPDLVGLR